MRAASQTRSSGTKSHADSNGGPGQGETEKFPDFDAGYAVAANGQFAGQRWQPNGHVNGNTTPSADRWHARRDSRVRWAPREPVSGPPGAAYGRRTSLSNAMHRMRSVNMSQNAQEIADALRAPVSWKLIVCPRLAAVDMS
jgi:solute carrier family 35 protein E1